MLVGEVEEDDDLGYTSSLLERCLRFDDKMGRNTDTHVSSFSNSPSIFLDVLRE